MPYARSHSKEHFAIAIGNEILTHGGAHLSDDPSLTHRKHTSLHHNRFDSRSDPLFRIPSRATSSPSSTLG